MLLIDLYHLYLLGSFPLEDMGFEPMLGNFHGLEDQQLTDATIQFPAQMGAYLGSCF